MKNFPKIKIIFVGSAEFSVPILLELIKKFTVQAIITEEDKPAGRGQAIVSPLVKRLAQQHAIPCWQPTDIKKNAALREKIEALIPDLLITAAYGKMLPEDILNIPQHGCLNVHPSLLPKYRGPSPIQAALLRGDKETGVSIILMDKDMDAGDIVDQASCDILTTDDYFSLETKLAQMGATLLTNIIPDYVANKLKLKSQNNDQAVYCRKITKRDGHIDWTRPASKIYQQIQAYKKWPGSFTSFQNKKLAICQARVWEGKTENQAVGEVWRRDNKVLVKCGRGNLELLTVQLEGKKPTAIKDFLNGHASFLGTCLPLA